MILILALAAPGTCLAGGTTKAELLQRIKTLGLTPEEAAEAKIFLRRPSALRDKALPSRQELRDVAKSYGLKEQGVPEVRGVCVNARGEKVPCSPAESSGRYLPRAEGIPYCPAKLDSSLESLRGIVLQRVESGAGTGSEVYDMFFRYLAEQFTGIGKAEDLPPVVGSPTMKSDAVALYTPDEKLLVSKDWCGMGESMRRKVLGHELFHHYDNERDGDPVPSGDAAEGPAYDVMRFL
jgi:hypothetical protein